MNTTEALAIMRQVGSVFKGTLEDHNKIKEAITTLDNAINFEANPPSSKKSTEEQN